MDQKETNEGVNSSSSSSQELNQIPLNKSMIQANNTTSKKKTKKKRNRRNKKKNSNKARGRSNTTEEQPGGLDEAFEPVPEITIDESLVKDEPENDEEENLNTKESTENSGNQDKKSSFFPAKLEEEMKFLDLSSRNDFDYIDDTESKMSLTSRELYMDEIKELYLGEPKWTKSSSWVKPVPHREYKLKTVWSEE
jgi:hypothetical protein